MIKFYYHPSPNPAKIALFLEEAGLPYELMPVDTRKGEQHLPAFTSINPNAKTPAIVDDDAVVFDSNLRPGGIGRSSTLSSKGKRTCSATTIR